MADKLYTDELVSRIQAPETNYLINGNFDYFQRTIGPVAFDLTTDYYGPDRWILRRTGTSGSCTAERDADTSTLGNFLLLKTLNTNTTYIYAFQRVESRWVEPLVGQNVIFGCWVWSTTAVDMYPSAYTPNSTADNWSSDWLDLTYLGANTVSVPADTWTWLEFSFEVPADGKNGVMVGFRTGSYTAVTSLWIKNAVFHRGTEKLPDYLVHTRTQQEEFAMCQRYYQKSFNINTDPGSSSDGRQETRVDGVNYAPCMVQFPVSMFSVPTVTLYDNSGNSGKVTVEGTPNISAAAAYVGMNGFGFMSFSGQSIGDYVDFHYTASAEI